MDKSTGVRSDQTVILTAIDSAKVYLDAPRLLSFYDADTDKRLKFLTNNFVLPALTIAQTYKSRWKVELFFRWIKQHLRNKNVFRRQLERGEHPDLDCRVGAELRPLVIRIDNASNELMEQIPFGTIVTP